jgi:sarcosine oxidase subunit alpha
MNTNLRLKTHPVLGQRNEKRRKVTIYVDNQMLEALEGETLAAALWANGFISLGRNPEAGSPRGMYCGIGHCYECRVTVDGIEDVRSCLVPVRHGMQVTVREPDSGKEFEHGHRKS